MTNIPHAQTVYYKLINCVTAIMDKRYLMATALLMVRCMHVLLALEIVHEYLLRALCM